MDESVISGLAAIFSSIWSGMENINLPGTHWPISGFFLALFTAGVIGLILKHIFKIFESHFNRGFRSGSGRPAGKEKAGRKEK